MAGQTPHEQSFKEKNANRVSETDEKIGTYAKLVKEYLRFFLLSVPIKITS